MGDVMIGGILFSLLAAFALGSGQVLARKSVLTLPSAVAAWISMFVIVVLLNVTALITHGPQGYTGIPLSFYFWVTLMAIFSFITGMYFSFAAMKRATVTIIAPIIACNALFSLMLAIVLGGERPNLQTILGALLIMIGVSVILTDRHRAIR